MGNPITPVLLTSERKRSEGGSYLQSFTHSKVKGCVLEKMSQALGGLLPTTIAPHIIIHLLPTFKTEKKGRKLKIKKAGFTPEKPIGLMEVEMSWVNALMQFIVYVPGFIDFFNFIPKSFSIFQDFIDQYKSDQLDGKAVSAADGLGLFRFIRNKVGSSLEESFQYLLQILQVRWELYKTFEEGARKEVADFFIAGKSLRRQAFFEGVGYDLDAFIEYRPDLGEKGDYFAYVKVGGIWFQCDDERISHIKSYCLVIALERSVLLHYKQIFFK